MLQKQASQVYNCLQKSLTCNCSSGHPCGITVRNNVTQGRRDPDVMVMFNPRVASERMQLSVRMKNERPRYDVNRISQSEPTYCSRQLTEGNISKYANGEAPSSASNQISSARKSGIYTNRTQNTAEKRSWKRLNPVRRMLFGSVEIEKESPPSFDA